jgi:stalled ribosome rescue protein Dom34
MSFENQVKFTTLLQKFMREEMPLEKFELAIIATNSFSHISEFIKSQDYKRIIKDTYLLKDQDIREIVH